MHSTQLFIDLRRDGQLRHHSCVQNFESYEFSGVPLHAHWHERLPGTAVRRLYWWYVHVEQSNDVPFAPLVANAPHSASLRRFANARHHDLFLRWCRGTLVASNFRYKEVLRMKFWLLLSSQPGMSNSSSEPLKQNRDQSSMRLSVSIASTPA